MDVKTRVRICKLIEKINHDPQFAEKISVAVIERPASEDVNESIHQWIKNR